MRKDPLVVPDVRKEPFLSNRRDAYEAEGIRGLLVVPITFRGSVRGTISFYYATARAISPRDIRYASAIANLAALAVTTAEHSEPSRLDRFVALHEGEEVPVLDVIASASDEPDYGFDIGVWSDNATSYGATYGFGKQPFGNPKISFASQAPMHMGFFHEAGVVYMAASFLRRTFPEYRAHLWRSLAAEAFRSGHPYWGWRFAGWGLHYVQDLTQPYHARVMPGAGALRMMWINALDIVGLHGPKTRAIALLTNRHLALENFEQHWLHDALEAGRSNDPALEALRGRPGEPVAPFGDASLRDSVTRRAFDAADAIDSALLATLPARLTSDPDYVFGVTEPDLDVHALLARDDPAAESALQVATLPLLREFGARSRDYVAAILAASPEARRR